MALKVRGGVIFNADGSVFEGDLDITAIGGAGDIAIADISDAGDAGKLILALDALGDANQLLETDTAGTGVDWVTPA